MEATMLKIVKVAYHRNSVAGDGFHVVCFDEGRGKGKSRKVGLVGRARYDVRVLDVDLLAQDVIEFGANSWDGPWYETELREAVLAYERLRVGSELEEDEVRDLKYGKHECAYYYRDKSSVILSVQEGHCIVCGGSDGLDDARLAATEPDACAGCGDWVNVMYYKAPDKAWCCQLCGHAHVVEVSR